MSKIHQDRLTHEALERIFHEPARLAIMSALCVADGEGRAFNELKEDCRLTDGNLNRHLKVLEDSNSVRMEKKFVGVKPRTTVYLTATGLTRFRQYLEALEDLLKTAQNSLPEPKKHRSHRRLDRCALERRISHAFRSDIVE